MVAGILYNLKYRIFLLYKIFCKQIVNQRAGELTYANMQIIAREVELEVMRRATPMQGPLNPVQPKKPAHQKPQNHLQKLATTSINLKNRTKDLVCICHLHFLHSNLFLYGGNTFIIHNDGYEKIFNA